MVFHGPPWPSIALFGVPWPSLALLGVPRTFMALHRVEKGIGHMTCIFSVMKPSLQNSPLKRRLALPPAKAGGSHLIHNNYAEMTDYAGPLIIQELVGG